MGTAILVAAARRLHSRSPEGATAWGIFPGQLFVLGYLLLHLYRVVDHAALPRFHAVMFQAARTRCRSATASSIG